MWVEGVEDEKNKKKEEEEEEKKEKKKEKRKKERKSVLAIPVRCFFKSLGARSVQALLI